MRQFSRQIECYPSRACFQTSLFLGKISKSPGVKRSLTVDKGLRLDKLYGIAVKDHKHVLIGGSGEHLMIYKHLKHKITNFYNTESWIIEIHKIGERELAVVTGDCEASHVKIFDSGVLIRRFDIKLYGSCILSRISWTSTPTDRGFQERLLPQSRYSSRIRYNNRAGPYLSYNSSQGVRVT